MTGRDDAVDGGRDHPFVAIPTARLERPGKSPATAVNETYVAAVNAAGGTPLLIPPLADLGRVRALYQLCRGLLLPGGRDVEPHRYGEPAAPPEHHLVCEPRDDDHELRLAGWALDDGLPVLGICKGMQVVNVALGGTLWQDLGVQLGATGHDGNGPTELVHPIEVDPASRLAGLTGGGTVMVNSRHHQAVREVAPKLVATAWAPDGVVEAVEHVDHPFVVAVQCHPEDLVPSGHEWSTRLFEGFLAAARG